MLHASYKWYLSLFSSPSIQKCLTSEDTMWVYYVLFTGFAGRASMCFLFSSADCVSRDGDRKEAAHTHRTWGFSRHSCFLHHVSMQGVIMKWFRLVPI